jgi:hypothetical protein
LKLQCAPPARGQAALTDNERKTDETVEVPIIEVKVFGHEEYG